MHLETVFLFIHRLRHVLELAGLEERGGGLAVDGKIAEGGCVGVAAGEGGAGEVIVVRGAEQEDTGAGFCLEGARERYVWARGRSHVVR